MFSNYIKKTLAILLTLMLLALTACGAADTAIGSAMVVSMSGANAGEKDGLYFWDDAWQRPVDENAWKAAYVH